MKKTWRMFSQTTFSISSTPIEVNVDEIREVLLSIDEAIIKAGFRYQILNVIPNHLFFDFQEIALTYKKDRLKNFWPSSRGTEIYSILQLHQWAKMSENFRLGNNRYPESLIYLKEGKKVETKHIFSSANPVISVYSNNIKFDGNEDQTLEIIIESHSDIWYEKNLDLIDPSIFLDNRENAFLNTPRLNSFIREIEEELNKYGTRFKKADEGNIFEEEISDNGVLLGGKLLYIDDDGFTGIV
ncbi:MAG: hypothetical protein HRU41_41540 [Saprospiraceae bacterium]|nr:hypothetical protein [Saprospiraceae bacterium]